GAGAVLEDARLADPEVHDAAFVHEVVVDRLDEASVRLRPFVGAGGARHGAVGRIDEVMPLGRSVDAVGPVQTCVEPLRTVRSGHLQGEHGAGFVEECLGIGLGRKVATFPAPVGPAARESAEYLASIGLAGQLAARYGPTALQPDGDAGLADFLDVHRDAG